LLSGIRVFRTRHTRWQTAPDLLSQSQGKNVMLTSTHSQLSRLEAAANISPQAFFKEVRQLGLTEYALLLEAQPLNGFPALSRLLPAKTSPETQKLFTGAEGQTLLAQSLDFVRYFRDQLFTHMNLTDRELARRKILDFGCGWGRLLRLMYFYFERDNIFGVDPWQRAIDECLAAGLGPNIYLTDRSGKHFANHEIFDAGYAFSVFTHLPERLMEAVLSNVRKRLLPGGVFVITTRPLE
jgi:SAM-dependent methyltransferase